MRTLGGSLRAMAFAVAVLGSQSIEASPQLFKAQLLFGQAPSPSAATEISEVYRTYLKLAHSGLGRFSHLSAEVRNECAHGLASILMTNALHFRAPASNEAIVGMLKTAFENFPEQMPFSQEELKKDPDLPSRVAQAQKAEKLWLEGSSGDAVVDCSFADRLSQKLGHAVTRERVWDALVNAYMQQFDPHSFVDTHFNVSEDRFFTESKSIGMGVYWGATAEKTLVVRDVVRSGPAAKAGVRAGDELVAISSGEWTVDAHADSLPEIVRISKENAGRVIRMVLKSSSGETRTVDVRTDYYEIEYARGDILPGGILKIRFQSFAKGAAAQIQKILKEARDIRGLVLDLRFNGGGLVTEATAIADLFIDRGLIAMTFGRNFQPEGSYLATQAGLATEVPMIVLLNRASASASEILAQTLSRDDYGRAILVGEKTTFGKGSVSRLYVVGKTKLMYLTESVYYTLSGTPVHSAGVRPDVVVMDRQIEEYAAKQREAALKGEGEQPLLVEADFANAMPTPPKLSPNFTAAILQKMEQTFGVVGILNPLASLFDSLALGLVKAKVAEDPALDAGLEVLGRWMEKCPTYRATSCALTPQLITQLRH